MIRALTLSLPGQGKIQIRGQRRCWEDSIGAGGQREEEPRSKKTDTRETGVRSLPAHRDTWLQEARVDPGLRPLSGHPNAPSPTAGGLREPLISEELSSVK